MDLVGYLLQVKDLLQVTGLIIGFLGTLALALKEIKTKKEIAEVSGTYADKNPYLERELAQRSQFAKGLAIVLTVSFALQLAGLALS